jgi:hypothetical protein
MLPPEPLEARPIVALLFVQLKTVPDTVPVKLTAVVLEPSHNSWLPLLSVTVGVGLTVTVKLPGVPVQVMLFVYVGVTVIFPVIGAVAPPLAEVNDILPEPDAPSPIAVLLLAQPKLVPDTLPLKLTLTGAPTHTFTPVIGSTEGVGFTVIVAFAVPPAQLFPLRVKVGVPVIVATTGKEPPLDAVNVPAEMLPVPLAPKPIEVALFVHPNVVVPPDAVVEKETRVLGCPLHNVWLPVTAILGDGFTVTLKLVGAPTQVSPIPV